MIRGSVVMAVPMVMVMVMVVVTVAVVMVAVTVFMLMVMAFVHHSVGFEQTHAQEKGQRYIPLY